MKFYNRGIYLYSMKHNIYCVNCGELIAERRITEENDLIQNECSKCNTSFNLRTEPEDEFAHDVVLELVNPPEAGKHDLPVLYCPFCGKDKLLKPERIIYKDEPSDVLICHNPKCKRSFTVEIL